MNLSERVMGSNAFVVGIYATHHTERWFGLHANLKAGIFTRCWRAIDVDVADVLSHHCLNHFQEGIELRWQSFDYKLNSSIV
jgi:hypothetical protein